MKILKRNPDTKLYLETSGLVSNVKLNTVAEDGMSVLTPLNTLDFEGLAGFNGNYVLPLFNLLRDGNPFFKYYRVKGNVLAKYKESYTMELFSINSLRQTRFIFDMFKNTYSIALSVFNLGIVIKSEQEAILVLDQKIYYVINRLADDQKEQILTHLYCLAKLFKAYCEIVPTFSKDPAGNLILNAMDLQRLYNAYGELPEEYILECGEANLSSDCAYESVDYVNIPHNAPVKEKITICSTNCDYCYNVLKNKKDQKRLYITNTSYATKEYYVVDEGLSKIYTNASLNPAFMFSFSNWIPKMVASLCELNPKMKAYRVIHVDTDVLLSSKEPELTVSNNADIFEPLLDSLVEVHENSNLKIYDGFFKTSKLVPENLGVDISSCYDNDPIAQELFKQYKDYYDTFDLKSLTNIVKGVAKGDVYSGLFIGEAGTGKSTAIRVISKKCGIPFIAINCSTNIEESDLLGSFVPNPNKVSESDPEFIWQDGPLTQAVRNGYIAIIEEISGARAGILMKFNSLLDEARQLDLPNHEILQVHPNFRLFATTNIAYEGTNRLNKSLIDRFDVCVEFEDLKDDEIVQIVKSRLNYTKEDNIRIVLGVYRDIKKYSEEQSINLVVSIREILKTFVNYKYYKTAKDCIIDSLVNKAFIEEPGHKKDFIDTILAVKKLETIKL